MEKELANLRIENAQLKTKVRSLLNEVRELRGKNDSLEVQNQEFERRVALFEKRALDLLEAVTAQNSQAQVSLLQEVYRAQIDTLLGENAVLKKKYEEMREAIDCSVCYAHVANQLLLPCGHSTCSSCFRQIEFAWEKSQLQEIRRLNQQGIPPEAYPERLASGPPCPFCRKEVRETVAKYNS